MNNESVSKPVVFTPFNACHIIYVSSKFALVTKRNNQIKIHSQSTCRETIHHAWEKKIAFIVSKWELDEKIKQIENRLKLKIKSKQIGIIYPYDGGCLKGECRYVIYVSPFWRQYSLFKSLFTAILNGEKYFQTEREKDNLKRFMNGKISFDPKFNTQWRNANYAGLKFTKGS